MARVQDPETFIDRLLDLFGRLGGLHYGEAVTQLEHALQTAHHARAAGDADSLVAAALLHDVGHLLQKQGEDAADRGIDTRHEQIGAAWLAQVFGPAVTEPVRLHVEAKRYLSAREPGYVTRLSDASLQSLALQGGPMTADEADAFERHPAFADAVALRRHDERGKIEGQPLPPLADYRPMLLALASAG